MTGQAGTSWRLLDTGSGRGSYNLALDEALFRLTLEGRCPPTVRFYSWSPPALSVGYFQAWERDIDEAACRERGIGIYRRITGGRAVLHRDEVTYSVVCGRSRAFFGEGILPAYRKIGRALAEGLKNLGVDVEVVLPDAGRRSASPPRHPSCFSSSIGYEISAAGKKLVGSAQKRQGDTLLQHGSILLDGHGEDFLGLLKRGQPSHERGPDMASLTECMGRRPAWKEVVGSVAGGFASSWRIPLLPGELTGEERDLARLLEATRYRSLLGISDITH